LGETSPEKFGAQEMLRVVGEPDDLLDEPLADPSVLPLYLLSQFASQHMKVVLSGDGGDELFAGYQTYQAHKLVTRYDALPRFVRESIKAAAFNLPVSHGYLSLDFKLKQFLRGVGVSSEVRFFLWRGAFNNSERQGFNPRCAKRCTRKRTRTSIATCARAA
jgi:asparagine synthase (glutamine-hydrolysing)